MGELLLGMADSGCCSPCKHSAWQLPTALTDRLLPLAAAASYVGAGPEGCGGP